MEGRTSGRVAPRVIGVGASAGGVEALIRLVRPLPEDLAAAVCVVLHIPATGRNLLAPVLQRHTAVPVEVAADGAPLEPGRIYVAPADRHLTTGDGVLRLDRGPKENAVRPAVDPMLRSLATAYGPRAIAVILSGALGDGSSGAVAVRQAGGTVIVQDPADATVPSMPETALRAVGTADAVLSAQAIGEALARLARPVHAIVEDVVMTPAADKVEQAADRPSGPPSGLTCPECRGPLWEVNEGDLIRYRCRVGHGYSEESLVVEQGSTVEAALWAALEALEERAEFLRGIASRHGDRRPHMRDRFESAAVDALDRAELIRGALGTRDHGTHALDLEAGAAR